MGLGKIIRVALCDDHKVVTHALRTFFESFPDIRVGGIAVNGEDLLERLPHWPRPDVVIVDLAMPGGMDGIQTTQHLVQAYPEVRVIALTASTDDARMAAVLRAGAFGYIRKDADPELLLQAVRCVANGRPFVDPAAAGKVMTGAASIQLTQREIEVLLQLSSGLTNREIGVRLFISEETVKTHVAHLLAKLQLQNRGQLTAYAIKHGMQI